MVEYSRNIGRLMVAWRWLLFLFVAFEAMWDHPQFYVQMSKLSDRAVHATPTFSPVFFLGLLFAWSILASALQFLFKSPYRNIAVAVVDAAFAILAVMSQRTLFGAMLFSLPALNVFPLGMLGGIGTSALLAVLYPCLALIISRDPSAVMMPTVSWYLPFMGVVTMAGIVMENLLKQELQARALVSVIETSQELGSSASLEKILNLVVQDVKDLFGCSTCVIYLRETDNPSEPVMRVAEKSTAFPEAFTDFNPDLMHSIVGQVIKEKKGRVVDDFQSYQPEEAIKKERAFRATMVAPLLFEDEAIGAIYVAHSNPAVYNDQLFRLFSMLANQVALAVRNVQLHKTTATLAITDSLSGLYTHGYFQEHLGKETIQAKYSKQPLSLLILDVDFFKKVNDSYGHPQGDALLKQLGGVIKQVTRPTDVVCRYGGDEFTVTMLNTNRISAVVIAERIRSTCEDYEFVLGNQVVHVTLSGGVASFPEDAETKKELIDKADHAMYEAKHKGRNRICFSA
ncbi:MAG: sensor domain-containing diguanylate cyclase [Armatimonadetes bacterium]|nr:sensor domain-containing diguanylate cyclase [Armatimonadota bacterium]